MDNTLKTKIDIGLLESKAGYTITVALEGLIDILEELENVDAGIDTDLTAYKQRWIDTVSKSIETLTAEQQLY